MASHIALPSLPRPRTAPIQWITLFSAIVVHGGVLLVFFPRFFTWPAFAVFLALSWLTGSIGVSMTFHRLLTHRSFSVRPKWLEYVLTVVGTCSLQKGAIGWVADHRRHHAHTDDELDVHTPRHGFWWSHILWLFTPEATAVHTPEYLSRWAPDLYRDPVHRVLDRGWLAWPYALAGLLYAIGGMPWLVWGFFARTFFILHVTMLVNSATHMWGYRSFPTRDDSRNNWWVALITYGEGWHNNHHAYQSSARIGLRWWELDVTYWLIRGLAALGVVYGVKTPRSLAPPARWEFPGPAPRAGPRAAIGRSHAD